MHSYRQSQGIGEKPIQQHPYIIRKIPESEILYVSRYLYRIIKNLLITRKQANFTHLPLNEMVPFVLTAAKQEKWYQFFNVSKNDAPDIPFTYYIRGAAFILFDFIDQLKLSFKYLYHIKSSIILHKKYGPLLKNTEYRLFHTLDDILKVKNNKLCIVTKMHILDSNNHEVVTAKNVFLLKVSDQDIEAFDQALHRPKHDAIEFEGLPKRISKIEQETVSKKVELEIFPKMGQEYGHLSGDINPLHTINFLAKLGGSEKALIQGYCMFNYIIRAFFLDLDRQFERINITFCRPVYEDQKVTLLSLGDRYEVVDSNNKVLVYGDVHGN